MHAPVFHDQVAPPRHRRRARDDVCAPRPTAAVRSVRLTVAPVGHRFRRPPDAAEFEARRPLGDAVPVRAAPHDRLRHDGGEGRAVVVVAAVVAKKEK